jgi:hypothetical protein
LEVLEVDSNDLGFYLDRIEIQPGCENRGALSLCVRSSRCFILVSTAILRLLRPEVSLLTVTEKPSQARVRHDIAEHLEALANKLGPLPDVWVEHVEMANVFVADVTGPGSHAGAAKKPLNESSAVRFNHASEPPLLRLW